MFYVHHHDDEIKLLNANCQAAVMLSHLRLALRMPPHLALDLLPYPTGDKAVAPVGLMERPQDQYCDQFLQLRGAYILLQEKPPETVPGSAAGGLFVPGGTFPAAAGGLLSTAAVGGVAASGGSQGVDVGGLISTPLQPGGAAGGGASPQQPPEMVLAWNSSKPEETERIAALLAQRSADAKKPTSKRSAKK